MGSGEEIFPTAKEKRRSMERLTKAAGLAVAFRAASSG
jgi:hypothetical protein